MHGACNGQKFGPAPWGLGEGSKGQISFNFYYKVNFQTFLYQILCVFSQIKDTKHTRQDFILSPGSCPRGGTLERWGCPGGQKFIFFKHGHVAYQIDGNDGQNGIQVKFSS